MCDLVKELMSEVIQSCDSGAWVEPEVSRCKGCSKEHPAGWMEPMCINCAFEEETRDMSLSDDLFLGGDLSVFQMEVPSFDGALGAWEFEKSPRAEVAAKVPGEEESKEINGEVPAVPGRQQIQLANFWAPKKVPHFTLQSALGFGSTEGRLAVPEASVPLLEAMPATNSKNAHSDKWAALLEAYNMKATDVTPSTTISKKKKKNKKPWFFPKKK